MSMLPKASSSSSAASYPGFDDQPSGGMAGFGKSATMSSSMV